MDADEIMAKHVEQLEAEKKELQARLKSQEKKVINLNFCVCECVWKNDFPCTHFVVCMVNICQMCSRICLFYDSRVV